MRTGPSCKYPEKTYCCRPLDLIFLASITPFRGKFSCALISAAQLVNARPSWRADFPPRKSRRFPGGGAASHVRHLASNGVQALQGQGRREELLWQAIICTAHQGRAVRPEGSDFSALHTRVASELTAMSVLKGERGKKKARSTAGVITGGSVKTSAPCPVAIRDT